MMIFGKISKGVKMNSLKKAIVIFGLSVFTLFFLCSAVWGTGLKLGFKFTAGINYQFVGDGNASLIGEQQVIYDSLNALGTNSGYSQDQFMHSWVSHFGYEFDADVILYITPQFGISLGTGYVRGGTLFGSGDAIISTPSSKETNSFDISASAIPIKVGVYYNLSSVVAPRGKSSAYVFAGLGLYLASFSSSQDYTFKTLYSNYSFQSKANGIGLYAGWGGESWVSRNFALIYEISGRYAKIGGFTGNWQYNNNGAKYSGSGKVYYFERLYKGNWYEWTELETDAPSGAGFKNVREAKIDFSGFSFKFGWKISI
jgi:hypothetical protein